MNFDDIISRLFVMPAFVRAIFNLTEHDIEELRRKYIENPPEGMTSKDIRHMSEDELLDMDYFLNDDELDDDFGEEGFYIF